MMELEVKRNSRRGTPRARSGKRVLDFYLLENLAADPGNFPDRIAAQIQAFGLSRRDASIRRREK